MGIRAAADTLAVAVAAGVAAGVPAEVEIRDWGGKSAADILARKTFSRLQNRFGVVPAASNSNSHYYRFETLRGITEYWT